MTSSARSKLAGQFAGKFAEGDPCPSCLSKLGPEKGHLNDKVGQLVSRPAYPYPVITQVLFGLSFVLFLVYSDKIQAHRAWVWSWSAVQLALGIVLVYRRRRASKRVLHCIRCGQDLR